MQPSWVGAALQHPHASSQPCHTGLLHPRLPSRLSLTQGDDANEMRLKLVSSSNEVYPFKDE